MNHVIGAVKEIRETTDLKICCCLGFLNEDQAGRLAEAGVHRYNHNLNTHANNYETFAPLIRMMIVLIQFKSETSGYFTMFWGNLWNGRDNKKS